MRISQVLIAIFIFHTVLAVGQPNSTLRSPKLKVVSDENEYINSFKADPNQKLVDIKKAIPNIVLDIRYATSNNFMKRVMYKEAKAFARKPVVDKLSKIQVELNKKGYGLKIFDAYRPYAITVAFYQQASDKHFVANPSKGSKHNRGCAVDLTLIELQTGLELPMPTGYDSFEKEAAANFPSLPENVIKNRALLIKTMQRNGFRVLENEWWHFDYIGWQNYHLMDIPFSSL